MQNCTANMKRKNMYSVEISNELSRVTDEFGLLVKEATLDKAIS